jgi:hypothetical protein
LGRSVLAREDANAACQLLLCFQHLVVASIGCVGIATLVLTSLVVSGFQISLVVASSVVVLGIVVSIVGLSIVLGVVSVVVLAIVLSVVVSVVSIGSSIVVLSALVVPGLQLPLVVAVAIAVVIGLGVGLAIASLVTLMMASNEFFVPLGVTSRIVRCCIVVAIVVVVVVAVLVLVCLSSLVSLLALLVLATLVVRLFYVLVNESLVESPVRLTSRTSMVVKMGRALPGAAPRAIKACEVVSSGLVN